MGIDFIPVPLLFALTIILVLVAIEVGYQIGCRAHTHWTEEMEAPATAITGSVLALVAFMLAFTFGIVSDRYDARKELVRAEASAIKTLWLRCDLLLEGTRAEPRSLILEYLSERLEFVHRRDYAPARIKEVTLASQEIQDRLWDIGVENARAGLNSDYTSLYVNALNEVITLRARRLSIGLQARIPIVIWLILYSIMLLGMTGLGYQTSISGSKRSTARPILALSFAMVVALIAMLDRPDSNLTAVSQLPQFELLEWITARDVHGVTREL
jgi:hypothetical protein